MLCQKANTMNKIIMLLMVLTISLLADDSSDGQTAYQRGQYGKAVIAFQKAIYKNEDVARNYFNLGNSLYKINQVGRALVAYENAIQVAPKFVSAHLNLGNVYFELGEVGKALISFERAASLDPTNAAIHKLIGDSYIEIHEYSMAASHFEQGRTLEPQNAGWDISLVEMYYSLNDLDAVEKPLRNAIKKAPDRLDLQVHFADVLVQLDKVSEAVEIYQGVLAQDAKNSDALFRLAGLYEQKENFFLAITTLKQAEQNQTEIETVEYEIGRLYQRIGDMHNSLEYYKKSAGRGEEKARNNLIQIANQYLSQGDVPMAVIIFKDVIRFYPGDIEAKEILQELAS